MRAKKAKILRYKVTMKSPNRDIYKQESLMSMHDDDVITSAEQGFMMGYLG